MDIHARVDDALAAPRSAAERSLAVVLLLIVLEYLREFVREARHSFATIERMEHKIMFDESRIQAHLQQSADALVAIQKGVQEIRNQLAVGNDTAVQSELDKLDTVLAPIATQAQAIADSFAPAPAPASVPVPEPPAPDPTV